MIERSIIRTVLITVAVGITLALGAIAFAGSPYASCPYDGEQAERVSTELVREASCGGDSFYNAERDTYRHTHVGLPISEQHTFEKTACLQ